MELKLYQLESNFKDIFFNQDKTRKTKEQQESKKILLFDVLKGLKEINGNITIEYIKTFLKEDERSFNFNNKKLDTKISNFFKNNEIKIKSFSVDRITKHINHLIIKKIAIPQYKKNDVIQKINLYPTITERKVIMGDKFIYTHDRVVSVGYPVKRNYIQVFHELEI